MASYGYIIIKTLITDIDPNAKVKEGILYQCSKRDREAAIEEEKLKIKIIKEAEAEESKRLQVKV